MARLLILGCGDLLVLPDDTYRAGRELRPYKAGREHLMSVATEQAKNSTNDLETLRSSFSCDGTRLFLIFDAQARVYRLATRWYWLTSFDSIWDACDAFEALELMEGAEQQIARVLKAEIKRVPRNEFGSARSTMGRLNYLINSAERRLLGLRPIRCGSKGSVERWVAV